MEIVRSGFAILAWALALGALGAGVLAQGGRVSLKLDVLTHFAPLYLAAAVAALVLAFAGPRSGRNALVVFSLLGVAAAATLMAPEYLRPRGEPRAAPDAASTLKIVQFNAWGGNRDAEAAVRWIVAQDPDVVVLEEAGRVRGPLIDAGYREACHGCAAAIFAKRRPVRRFVPFPRDGEPSYITSATYRHGGAEFTVVAAHRYWPIRFTRERAQTESLGRYIATQSKERLILAGDFNSTPWSFARQREDRGFGLIRRTRGMFTWPAARLSHNRLPAPFPYMPIDHVYAGPGWATVKVERGPRLGSDHYPVVVTLAPVESSAR